MGRALRQISRNAADGIRQQEDGRWKKQAIENSANNKQAMSPPYRPQKLKLDLKEYP
jgi:hypothetical protein